MNRNTLNWLLFLGSIATLLLLFGVRGAETREGLAPDAPDADPELFVTGETMESMALADGIVYWSTRDGCPGFEFLPICKVRSKPAGDGWSRTTYNNTSGARANDLYSNVAADEQYIYWISDGGNVLRLLRYGSATATPQVVAPLENTTSAGEIAVDEDYAYWTENVDLSGTTSDAGKLFRAPKAGGARQEMNSKTQTTLRQLQADGAGGALYIADTCGGICFPDVLHRSYHNGSTFVTTTSNSVLIESFATDGANVYWATTEGVDSRLHLLRAPLTNLGNTSEGPQLAPDDTPDVPAMAVDEDNLYWHRSNGVAGGPIFRLAKSAFASGTPAALTANQVSVLDLVSDGRYLFWHDKNVIYRLATDAAAYEIDASIADMEVTQGIQNLDNDVPLVHDRWTMVRVYPGFSSASFDAAGATINLHGTRAGSALPGSPLTARHINATSAGYDRDLLDDSANFVLPSSWLEGDVTLRAEISVFGLHDTNTGNNSQSVNVNFTPKSNICIKFLPLQTTAGLTYYVRNLASGNFTPGFQQIVQRFNTLWPAPNVPFYTQGLPLRKPCFLCAPNPPFNMVEDKAWVIHALWEHNVFDEAPEWCGRDGARTHYVGMVHPGVNTDGTGGYARLYEPLSWVKMSTGGADPYHDPHGGGVMAQEIGHNHNGVFGDRWAHVDCGLPDGDDPYDGYPYNPMNIGPLGPRTYWGFDRMSDSIIQPDEASDYMSYCAPRWTSDHNWRGAMDATNNTSFMAPPLAPAGVGGDFILVTGIIAHDEREAELVATYRLPGEFTAATPAARAEGDAEMHPTANYALQLLSGSGAVLASHPVTPTIGTHHDHSAGEFGGDYNFITSVPDSDGVAALRLTKDGAELARRLVSPNAPIVSNVTPAARGHYTDTMPITWDASDADGDPLHYIVQYSPDDGASWQAIATGLTESNLLLDDTGNLPGSEKALLRVIASDGVNVGMATSGSFSLEPHAPWAIIEAPAEGAAFAVDEPVVLEGKGLDMEDGLLTGSSVAWFITGPASGAVSGEQFTIHNVAPGTYNLQLIAEDSDGMQGSATSTFVISPKRVYDGAAPHLDGYCDDEAYGNEEEPLSINYGLGDAAMVRFVRVAGDVYVCFSGLEVGTNATQYAGLKVDVDNSGGEHMSGDDRLFYVRRDGLVTTGSGNGAGSETYDPTPQGLAAMVSETGGFWTAEMRIDQSELGGWNHMVRLQAGHYDRNFVDNNRVWPQGSAVREPDAWGLTALGRQAQSITFPAPPDMAQEDGPFTLEASSSSGLPVSFVSLTPDICDVGGQVVDLLAAGQCQIRASQPGNGSYMRAADVTRSFEVTAAQGHPSLRLYLPILRR